MCIEDFMQQIRRQRLDAEREAVLTVRFQALKAAVEAHYVSLPKTADMDHRPQAIDFAFTNECRALLDVPIDVPAAAAGTALRETVRVHRASHALPIGAAHLRRLGA